MPVDGGRTAAVWIESSRKSQALLQQGRACDFRLLSIQAAQSAAHRHCLRDLGPSATSAMIRLGGLFFLQLAVPNGKTFTSGSLAGSW
jgi:hypothetical protein